MVRQVLLYSPNPASTVGRALIERGWSVQVAATAAECAAALAGSRVELVILDDPPLGAAKDVVAMLDAGAAVPRLWLSTWPEAPVHSGRLGVDALVLDPTDVDAIAEHAERVLAPRPRRTSTGNLFAVGSSPSLVPPKPRAE